MRKAFAGVAALLMVVVVIQFFLAGSGAFDNGPVDEAFKPHRSLGYLTVILAIVLTLAAAVARMPGRIIGLAGLVAGLTLLQPVIAVVAKGFGDEGTTTTAGQIVFGLHAVNGLVIMAVLRNVLMASRQQAAPAHSARTAS
ncbi:hypothetical protein DFJ67_7068 [Asanoa ferruginea]|uniref:Uncharacterized protein n=1 Tax=Asanoa ferruginea TaxID=53367 RepID=A0A3D9ZUD5_9ACTN|nr:DUF6220 domain-containing protein [Asanoa ferruginea]REG00997.1 hypothetical protein DFJ67_7068 [Asanoa ferruginea]GIF47597.1 hypothetical protein Afe04nite_21360 [Asanoa ferruginea]